MTELEAPADWLENALLGGLHEERNVVARSEPATPKDEAYDVVAKGETAAFVQAEDETQSGDHHWGGCQAPAYGDPYFTESFQRGFNEWEE